MPDQEDVRNHESLMTSRVKQITSLANVQTLCLIQSMPTQRSLCLVKWSPLTSRLSDPLTHVAFCSPPERTSLSTLWEGRCYAYELLPRELE